MKREYELKQTQPSNDSYYSIEKVLILVTYQKHFVLGHFV